MVNCITENPGQTNGSLSARYGANRTSDLMDDVSLRGGKTGLYLFGSRYQPGGYSLKPETAGYTDPQYIPSLAGRLGYASLRRDWVHKLTIKQV
ncbi:hypothetical protein [Fibrella arboris]|uniref:hypothetical protein n=1 Tax=Fibrella arboris TaxID=3242486 RepID=UPI003522A53D